MSVEKSEFADWSSIEDVMDRLWRSHSLKIGVVLRVPEGCLRGSHSLQIGLVLRMSGDVC